jgi:hypothetical protein
LPPAIEAVGQVVLDADADDVPVFFHPCADNKAQGNTILNLQPDLTPLQTIVLLPSPLHK